MESSKNIIGLLKEIVKYMVKVNTTCRVLKLILIISFWLWATNSDGLGVNVVSR